MFLPKATAHLKKVYDFLASELAVIHDCAKIGPGSVVEVFCVVGEGAEQLPADQRMLTIGPRARLRSHTVVYAGSTIGEDFQTGHHVLIREMNIVGDRVSIGSHSVVEHHVQIGNGVRLHSNCFVPEFSTLEDDCWLGPGVILTNAKYPRSRDVKERLEGPTIGRGAKIGAGALVLPGVKIGPGALVGAGAIVTEDVPSDAVIRGEPSRVVGSVVRLSNPDGSPVY